MKRVAFLVPASLSVLVIASACTLRKPIATHAVAYNRSVEQAANQVLLLNIVRSMNREPQHFTAITQVLGSATASLTPSLTIAGSTDSNSITGAFAGSFTHGAATVTVGVLDTEEFTRAIMNPIDLDLLDYFMQQGWHEELLYLLFIRQIDIKDDSFSSEDCSNPMSKPDEDGKTISIYKNHPGNPSEKDSLFREFRCFRARLRALIDDGLRIELAPAAKVGFDLKTKDLDKLAELMLEADKAGLRVQTKVKKSDSVPVWDEKRCDHDRDSEGLRISSDADCVVTYQIFKKARSKQLVWGEKGENRVQQAFGDVERLDPSQDEKATEYKATVYFRSPEGVLYYLGQIARAQEGLLKSATGPLDATGLEPRFETSHEKVADGEQTESDHLLFVMMLKDYLKYYPGASVLLEVRYDGKDYVIPELDPTDRTMSVLSIVNQLFDLNKSRKDLPGTGVVTITGGS